MGRRAQNTRSSLTDTTDTLVIARTLLKMKTRILKFILRNHAAKSTPSPFRGWTPVLYLTTVLPSRSVIPPALHIPNENLRTRQLLA